MYMGIKDDQTPNSSISFCYHLAYWDRLDATFSVHLICFKACDFLSRFNKKREKRPFYKLKNDFMLNRRIRGYFHTNQLDV